MQNDKFVRESSILIISNLTTGVFGFIFSIILSKKLGAEGMGLYGLIMPIYDLFICLICGGIITAISKISSIYFYKKDFSNLNGTIDAIMSFDIIWAIIIAVMVFSFSPFISKYIIKDARALHALQIMCPAMIFIAMSSIFKGYFYGCGKAKIPAMIDILEKAMRVIIFFSISYFISRATINSTVSAAYTTLTCGEFISIILLYVFYKLNRKKMTSQVDHKVDKLQLLFDVFVISFPLCLNGFLSTAIGTISTLILPRRLVSCGMDYSAALSLIGKFADMALIIPVFPVIIINSICTILIPDLSRNISNKNYFAIDERIGGVLRISLLLGLSALAVCICIPDSLGMLFFGRADLGPYIAFIALSAPILYVATTSNAILNGLGKQNVLLKNSLIISIENLFLIYALSGITSINIYGYGIALFTTALTLLLLNFYEIKKQCFISFSLSEALTYIFIFVLVFLILSTLKSLIPDSDSLFLIKTISLIACSFCSFLVLNAVFKAAK
jgi:stage V sporulation protein B